MTAEFIAENDEIGEFLTDETEPDAGAIILLSTLHSKYVYWCSTRNGQAKKLNAFSQDVATRYKKERKKAGNVFIGLKFKHS